MQVLVAILASRVDAQYLICLGALGTGLASLLFAVQDSSAPYWQYQFVAMVLSVVGADFIFCCGIMYVSQVAPREDQAMAGGLFNCGTMVGTSFGLAINTIIQARVTQQKVEAEGGVYDPNQVSLSRGRVELASAPNSPRSRRRARRSCGRLSSDGRGS